jgi:TonB family protein
MVAVMYAPQWLRHTPFKVPVSYEVTLVAPPGGGGQARARLSPPAGAKAAAPAPQAAQPRDLLTLPSTSRPVIPQTPVASQTPVIPQAPAIPHTVVRPLPPPTRTDEMTLSTKRPLPERRAPAPLVPPPAPPAIVAPRSAPPIAQIVPPAVALPPPLSVVKPAPLRSVQPAPPAPILTTPVVVAPRVAPPPAISQPVIRPPALTLPKVTLGTGKEARLEAKAVKPAAVAPPAITAPAIETEGQSGAGVGIGVGTETGVTVGNTDPALAYYIVLIQDKIEGNWTPPKMSPGTMASVVLSLRIFRSGQVRDMAVDSSSEDRLLDDSALRAVRLSTPLPPLPPLYKAETLFLRIRFNFEGVKS